MNSYGHKNSGSNPRSFRFLLGGGYLGPAPGWPLLDEILATCLSVKK